MNATETYLRDPMSCRAKMCWCHDASAPGSALSCGYCGCRWMVKHEPGTKVRFFSAAGPCLPATVIRVNRTTYSLDFYGNKERISHSLVHATPCHSCQDHPKTQYPNGYMD